MPCRCCLPYMPCSPYCGPLRRHRPVPQPAHLRCFLGGAALSKPTMRSGGLRPPCIAALRGPSLKILMLRTFLQSKLGSHTPYTQQLPYTSNILSLCTTVSRTQIAIHGFSTTHVDHGASCDRVCQGNGKPRSWRCQARMRIAEKKLNAFQGSICCPLAHRPHARSAF